MISCYRTVLVDNPETKQERSLEQGNSLKAKKVNYLLNRIYNIILDRGWFPGRLFVRQWACDHVGVRLQVSDLNFL